MSENLRTVFGAPSGDLIAADGARLTLGCESDDFANYRYTWATALASINEWISSCESKSVRLLPPAHSDGVNVGYVVDAIVKDDRLYFHVVPNADVLPLHDTDALPRVSPGFRANYTDHAGRVWPLVVLEVSYTSLPRIAGVGESNADLLAANFSNSGASRTGAKMEETLKELLAQVKALHEAVAALSPSSKKGEETGEKEVELLLAENEKLAAENGAMKAEVEFSTATKGMNYSATQEAALRLAFKTDLKLGKELVAQFSTTVPAAPAAGANALPKDQNFKVPGAGVEVKPFDFSQVSGPELYEQVKAFQAENKIASYKDAQKKFLAAQKPANA